MKEEIETPIIPQKQTQKSLLAPHMIVLIAMWLLITVALVTMLFQGVRNTNRFSEERNILQAVYVLTLFWYLIRTGTPFKHLPEISHPSLSKLKPGKLIPAIVIALLFIAEFSGQVMGIVRLLLFPASIWILIIWRREIRFYTVILGILLAAIAYLGGLPFYLNQYFDEVVFTLFLAFVMPMFVAGGLLNNRTGLGGSQLFAGQYKKAVISFLWGCLLFIPLGLTNAASGSPGSRINWVTRWWIPLSQPWFSGIVEEAMWRLFLVSLCYFMLRPAFNKHPAIAVACSMLFSAIIFGLGHGGSFQERFLITGLLYGLPMAVVFAKRDWEHAVGAHYMINMIPTLMVFLET